MDLHPVQNSDLAPKNNKNNVVLPSSFHYGAAGFAFGDGHAEIKKWQDKRTIVPHKNSNGMPSPPGGLNQAASNSPDVAWMQDRASARKFRR